MTVDEAVNRVDAWLGSAPAVVVGPTSGHPRVVRDLLREVGAGVNLVNGAHRAASVIDHRAGVVSYDNDFYRFPRVRWVRPGDAAP